MADAGEDPARRGGIRARPKGRPRPIELTASAACLLGLFTGIMAFLGAVLNFSFVFAGSAGVNPAMILVSGLLILAWRNAGWYGLDRFVLPKLGTPWHRGEVFAPSPGSGTRVPT